MDLEKRIGEITQEMIDIRRELHQYPELGTKEFETGKIICKYLDKWGIEYT